MAGERGLWGSASERWLFCLWPKSLEVLEGCFSWADMVHWWGGGAQLPVIQCSPANVNLV